MVSSTYRHVPAVDKAARILSTLRVDHPLGISDLARRIGASKGTVRDILLTLVAHEMVRRDADGRFRLPNGSPDLRAAARPALERLARDHFETALLGVADGDAIVIADVAAPAAELHMAARIGQRVPIDAGAHGKVLVRSQTVGLDDEEYLRGVRAAAAPIVDGDGRRVAVLIAVGFSSRIPRARLRRIGEAVAEQAAEVSARLARKVV